MNIIFAEIVENGKKIRKPLILDDRKCAQCGAVFQPKRQGSLFCSKKCRQKYDYQKHKARYSEYNKQRYLENLEYRKIKRKEYYAKNRTQALEYSRRWRDKNKKEYLAKNSNYHDRVRFGGLRDGILSGNEQCSICGSMNKLVVHHVDHNKDHNATENLIVLCRKCHINEHRMDLVKAKRGVALPANKQ